MKIKWREFRIEEGAPEIPHCALLCLMFVVKLPHPLQAATFLLQFKVVRRSCSPPAGN